MTRQKSLSDIFMIMTLLTAALVLASLFTTLFAQEQQTIVRPEKLETKDDIRNFIYRVLQDKTRRGDPFTRSEQMGIERQASLEPEQKPRPEFGLGKYDIEQLVLKGFWESDENLVAIVTGLDGKTLLVKEGDEAYDGMIVEINPEGRYIKFFQKLIRRNPAQPDAEPEEVFVEKIVSIQK